MSTSALQTKMNTEAQANPIPWTTAEAAVEVLKTALAAGPTGPTVVEGADAATDPPTGNPLVVAGVDGTNVQYLRVDTSGRPVVVGPVTDGAAISGAGNPLIVGGSDGTNAQIISTDANGNLISVGSVASGAADSGNPVKIGGRYNATQPTYADGQRGDLQIESRGALRVAIMGGTSQVGVSSINGDGAGAGNFGLFSASVPFLFNGAGLDRGRNNTSTVLLASAARTTTQTSADIINYNAVGIHWTIDVTAIVDSPSLVATIQAKDANGIYYTIFTSAAIVGVSTNVYKLYPGITVAANLSVSDVLPRTFRLVITAADADSATYSSAYSLIL